jgi:hypothetical protein
LILLFVFLAACDASMKGPELVETGEVLEVIYSPGRRQEIKTTWEDTLLGSGNIPHTSKVIESENKYSVVFKCQHGKFVIEDEGKGTRAERLWKKLEKGSKVRIRYCEVMKNGKVDKYEFVDAEKIQ